MRSQKLFILVLLLGVGGLTSYFLVGHSPDLPEVLKGQGLKVDLEGFKLKDSSTNLVKDHQVHSYTAFDGEAESRITVIENGAAASENYFSQRVFQINSQYNRGASPYPGQTSQTTVCPAEFAPTIEKLKGSGWNGLLIKTVANPRRQLGVCDNKEIKFDAAILLLTCEKSGTLFDLTLLTLRGSSSPADRLRQSVCL